MSSTWFGALLPGLLGAVALYALYRLLQTRWPTSYYSAEDLTGQAVSRSLPRYVAFRFGPVYACATIVAQAAGRPVAAVTTFGVLHALLTVLPGGISALRAVSDKRRVLFVHLMITAGVAAAIFAAYISSPIWNNLLPDPDKYLEGLLTSTFTALVFFMIYLTVSRTPPPTDGAQLLKNLNPRVLKAVVESAAVHRVDRDFALTIAVVESLQRPSWVRPTERLLGTLRIARTFGPLQGSRSISVDDEASIDDSIRRLSPTILARPGSYTPSTILQFNLERHNKSEVFITMGEEVYRAISGEIVANSDSVGLDGSPAVRILSKRRVLDQWVLLLDGSAEITSLTAQALRTSEDSWRSVPSERKQGAFRPVWKIECSIYDEQLVVDAWQQRESAPVRLTSYL